MFGMFPLSFILCCCILHSILFIGLWFCGFQVLFDSSFYLVLFTLC